MTTEIHVNGHPSGDGTDAARRWVDLCHDLMLPDPDRNHPIMVTCLKKIAVEASTLYAELESGNCVEMRDGFFRDDWLPMDPADAHEFMVATGDFMFSAVDGPMATATAMERTLDQLHHKLR